MSSTLLSTVQWEQWLARIRDHAAHVWRLRIPEPTSPRRWRFDAPVQKPTNGKLAAAWCPTCDHERPVAGGRCLVCKRKGQGQAEQVREHARGLLRVPAPEPGRGRALLRSCTCSRSWPDLQLAGARNQRGTSWSAGEGVPLRFRLRLRPAAGRDHGARRRNVKGWATDVYRLKAKLMLACHGIWWWKSAPSAGKDAHDGVQTIHLTNANGRKANMEACTTSWPCPRLGALQQERPRHYSYHVVAGRFGATHAPWSDTGRSASRSSRLAPERHPGSGPAAGPLFRVSGACAGRRHARLRLLPRSGRPWRLSPGVGRSVPGNALAGEWSSTAWQSSDHRRGRHHGRCRGPRSSTPATTASSPRSPRGGDHSKPWRVISDADLRAWMSPA